MLLIEAKELTPATVPLNIAPFKLAPFANIVLNNKLICTDGEYYLISIIIAKYLTGAEGFCIYNNQLNYSFILHPSLRPILQIFHGVPVHQLHNREYLSSRFFYVSLPLRVF